MKNKIKQILKIGEIIELTKRNILVWQPEIKQHIIGGTLAGNVGILISKSPSVSFVLDISDIIFYGDTAGVFVKFNGETFVLLEENEVLGKFSYIDGIVCSPIPFVDDFKIGVTNDWQKYFDELATKNGDLLTGNNLNLQIN